MRRLEITTEVPCLTNCYYCPQGILRRNYDGKQIMSLDDFIKYIKKVPASVHLHFSGFCDPFQNEDCSKMIAYASERFYEIVIYTNLLNITDYDIDLICKYDIREFYIHAPHKRSNQNNVDKFFYNLNKLVNINYKFKVIDVNSPLSVLNELGKMNITTIVQNEIGRAGNNFQVTKMCGHIFCTEDRLNQPVLLPDGTLVLCCQDYGLRHKLGNLNDSSYDDIMDGPEIRHVVQTMKGWDEDSLCRHCEKAAFTY